jgi:neutral trehalase
VQDSGKGLHILNRYWTDSIQPRPESFAPDELTAWILYQQIYNTSKEAYTPEQARQHKAMSFHTLSAEQKAAHEQLSANHIATAKAEAAARNAAKKDATADGPLDNGDELHIQAPFPRPPHPVHDEDPKIQMLYSQLAAAAETGWDFSSRWFHDRENLTSVETMDLIPVDLNAILYRVETGLQFMWEVLGNQDRAVEYGINATARKLGIQSILWNSTANQWQDYHIDQKTWKQEVMISNFIPLWTKCYDVYVSLARRAVRRCMNSVLIHVLVYFDFSSRAAL